MSHLHPSTLIFFLAITSFTTSHLLSRDLETPIRSIRRLFPEITLFTTSFSFNQHTCHSPRRLQRLRVSGQISSFGTQQRAVKRGYIPEKIEMCRGVLSREPGLTKTIMYKGMRNVSIRVAKQWLRLEGNKWSPPYLEKGWTTSRSALIRKNCHFGIIFDE